MKLTLSQQELELAIRSYVTNMISLKEGTDIGIDFTAGRGDKGITAEIDISYMAVTSIPAVQAAKSSTAQEAKQAQETRKTDGKSLFGKKDEEPKAANDDASETKEEADKAQAEELPKGPRKTLFSEAG